MRKSGKAFLYGGLGVLFIAFAVKWTGMSECVFRILLGTAIALKAVFLVYVFRAKGFRPGLWLYLILSGVAMILVSMLFRTAFPVPALSGILFYGAIALKVTGLILMLFSKRK
ncbi:MAG: hypothetical protein LBS42_07470 [Tannerella sp.]|jgi:uncharacterized membrane protein HdeD (DUF308 family)|nr:hypothetical protein [Tannerella sp.]